MKARRILLHDRTGVPFTVQLGRELARREHTVLYSYGAFFQSPKGNLARKDSDVPNFQIEGMHLRDPFQKYSFVKRRFQEIEYANQLVKQIRDFEPDVIILAGSHPDALNVVYRKCRTLEVRLIFWVQDIYGLGIKRILSKKLSVIGKWIGNYYIWQERRLLQQSDEVVLITEDFIELMESWGIDGEKLHVVHNWTPIDEVPVRSKDNSWAQEHDLVDKFCILYAGTLGLKHNPELLLQLALNFQSNDQVRVVVISEGLGADWLRERKLQQSLENLVLLDFQPFAQMPDVLGSADILVAILEQDAGVYSAPSKVLTYLCAERALLLAVPPENLSAQIVAESKAGLVIPPKEVDAFVAAAEELMLDSTLRYACAANARKYAENHFDIAAIGDRFEEIISA